MDSPIDQTARDGIRDVHHQLNGHMQTTEIHLRNMDTKMNTNHAVITEKVEDVRKAILWAGGLIISIMLSVLAWSVLQQISANESQ